MGTLVLHPSLSFKGFKFCGKYMESVIRNEGRGGLQIMVVKLPLV